MSGNTSQHQPKRPRPNYFLSLPLAHYTSLTSHIELIQNKIKEHDPTLEQTLVDPASAHLTLFVLALDDKNEESDEMPSLQSAIECMESSVAQLESQDLLKPFNLQFKGLGHFQHRVVFLKLADTEEVSILQRLYSSMHQHFSENGILLAPETASNEEEDSFSPHLTIAKTSKLRHRKTKGKQRNLKIPLGSYLEFQSSPLDHEYPINELQLCKMEGIINPKFSLL
eukprot:g7362.t2